MLSTLRRRLLAADPGLQRTHTAARVTVAVAIALAVAYPLARLVHQPATVILAVSVALETAVPASARTLAERLRTAAIAWLVAAAAATLGVALAPYALASYAAFVAIMTAAAWASRVGPRERAIGLLAVVTNFIALTTHAPPSRLPWILAAVTVGSLVALGVRLILLPDPPAPRLRRLLVALRVRGETLAGHAARATAAASPDGARHRALAHDEARVDEVVLQLHDLLGDHPDLVADDHGFRRHLFAVVTLGHLLVLRAEFEPDASAPALAAPAAEPAERLQRYLAALESAAASAGRGERGVAPARSERRQPPPLAGATATTTAAPGPSAGAALGAPARTALQVAVAGTIAVAVGAVVSPQRWYWVALSSFFVFVNTGSRGATLRKAVERMAGTAGGVAAGLVVGFLLAGQTGLELAAIFPLLFVGFWMLQRSYAVMIAMITILLALLLDLTGSLTPELLLLRLLDTVIGATIGSAVAFLMLPTRTTGAVEAAFRGYLSALDELLAAMTAAAPHGDGMDGVGGVDVTVLAAARALDRQAVALRAAVRTADARLPGRAPGTLQRRLLLTLAARYWAHRAAARLVFHPGDADAPELERAIALVRRRVDGLLAGRPDDERPVEPATLRSPEALALLRADAVLYELGRARAGGA